MTKVDFDKNWNTWTVECGTFYGVVNPAEQAWMVEFAGDKANADRIARNADRITAALGDHKHVRLTITFNGDTMMITNYDWDKLIADKVPAVA